MSVIINADPTKIVNQTLIPQNGVDFVNQSSVQLAYQDILNNTYYIAGFEPTRRPHVAMIWTTVNTITVNYMSGCWLSKFSSPLTYVSVSNAAPTVISNANLDIPGSFVANTNYYVYAKYSTDFVAAFEISVTAPDGSLVFKGTDKSRRYIGHFVTDAAAHILPFQMTDYHYSIPRTETPAVGATITINAGTPTASANISLSGYPTSIKSLDLYLEVINQDALRPTLTVAPTGITSYASSFYKVFSQAIISAHIPVGIGGAVTCQLSNPGITTLSQLYASFAGYWE